MSNTPHMLPCPFCGGDARYDAHADDCYFILHRKFNNSGADMSLAFEVLDAWNRRAPQPVVREPPSDKELASIAKVGAIATDASGKVAIWPALYRNQMVERFERGWREAEKHYGITQKGGD